MERIKSTPRADWQSAVEARGLKWHTGQTPYWSEDAYYRFTTEQIDTLERATNELHERCLEAVQHVIDEKRYAELKIPEHAIPLITKSWNDEPPSVYGRFDLAYDGKTPPKMLTKWSALYNRVATIWRGRGLSEQTVAGFMERLGADPVGQELVAVAAAAVPAGVAAVQQAVDRTLQGVAQKFEAFGDESTTFFERRARLISVGVAMVVAVALHVDAIDLFKTLMRNPDARAAVLA